MSYQYIEFDGVSLPLYDHQQDHDPMPAESTLIDSIGGAFDWTGTARKKGRKQIIPLTGIYVGETEYLVDETGDRLVDEDGDFLIAGNGEQMLGSQVGPLLAKKGVTGQLWRERLADGVLEWKTARLLSVSWPRVWEDHAIKASLTCQFETKMEYWHAESRTFFSVSATDAVNAQLLVENVGEAAEDGYVVVTRTSGTISAVQLACAELGISWLWTGSIGGGEALVIDAGTQTVYKGNTDSYGGFSLGAAHTVSSWLPIPQGMYTFDVTVIGGNATVSINFYNQFP